MMTLSSAVYSVTTTTTRSGLKFPRLSTLAAMADVEAERRNKIDAMTEFTFCTFES